MFHAHGVQQIELLSILLLQTHNSHAPRQTRIAKGQSSFINPCRDFVKADKTFKRADKRNSNCILKYLGYICCHK